MNSPAGSRRISLALHAAGDPEQALHHAAALAVEFESELTCLFVEDQALFALCDLPSVEVAGATGTMRRPEASTLERQLRARAEHARDHLSKTALALQLPWSFSKWRGRPLDALLEASRQAEVVIASSGYFGPALHPAPRRATARIGALLEGSAADEAVMKRAIAIARRLSATAVALVSPERPRRARHAAGGSDMIVLGAGPDAVADALRRERISLLMLHAHGEHAAPERLLRVVAAPHCDVALLAGDP